MSAPLPFRRDRGDEKNFVGRAPAEISRLGARSRATLSARRPSFVYSATPNSLPVIIRPARTTPEPPTPTPGWFYLAAAFVLVAGIGAMAQASRSNDVSQLEDGAARRKVVSIAMPLNTPRRLPADRFIKER